MAFLAGPRNRVTVLFGLLFGFQAVILFGALSLFSALPNVGVLLSPEQFLPVPQSAVLPSEGAEAERSLTEAGIAPPSERSLLHTVESGETLALIWSLNGAPRAGALQAARAFKEAGFSSSYLKKGEKLELKVSPVGEITDLRRRLQDGRTLVLQGDSLDGYRWSVLPPDIEETTKVVFGTILSSFSVTAAEMGIPYSIVDEFVDLFSSRVEFNRDLQPGDTFTVSYKERRSRDGGLPLPPGSISRASLQTNSQLLVAIEHIGRDGRARYYDEEGKPLGNYFLRYPLKFSRISSAFSWARFHPILQRTRPHLGIDFAAPYGTPVRAVADGVVVEAGFRREGGNTIKIAHSKRYSTAYLHLAHFAPAVRKGARVRRGQIIGSVGSSGLSTGPHLHFSLFDNGTYVNPLKAKLPTMPADFEPIPQSHLMAALEEIRHQHAIIAMAGIRNSSHRRS